MLSKIVKIEESAPDIELLSRVAEALKRGETVVFPTETVYGIGVDAFNENAVRALYEKKKRLKKNTFLRRVIYPRYHSNCDNTPLRTQTSPIP